MFLGPSETVIKQKIFRYVILSSTNASLPADRKILAINGESNITMTTGILSNYFVERVHREKTAIFMQESDVLIFCEYVNTSTFRQDLRNTIQLF